ncbi:methionine import ATP-binding protein MetN 2 [Betaproteobacteria bacterium]|nr:methionine import ATP-binding protein MetN 2 [Betaproteobacteria bacterium]GHU41054.1 methionine import ATP-binding protein MetN 2 [Betaproteobacteria bacterium]
MPPLLEWQQVSKHYRVRRQAVAALRDINLAVYAGEAFGIIGRSGAGKSTLIRLANRLERPDSGRVYFAGEDVGALDDAALRALRQKVSMIFQHFNLLSSRTVAENVAFPLRIAGVLSERDLKQRVNMLLDRVGLSAHAGHYPAQLSGGQKQRVGIARALATQPRLLLCDEATSALDPQTTREILHLLAELRREFDLTIVLITHEMQVIRALCDRVAVLEAGRVVESGAVADVFLAPTHPASRSLVHQGSEIRDEESGAQTLLRLSFRGDPCAGALALLSAQGGAYRLVSGHIDHIGALPYGQFLLARHADADDAAVAAAHETFRVAGINIEAAHP